MIDDRDDEDRPGMVIEPGEYHLSRVEDVRRHVDRVMLTEFDGKHCAACTRRMPDGPSGVVENRMVFERGMFIRQFGICERCTSTRRNSRRAIRQVQERLERAGMAVFS